MENIVTLLGLFVLVVILVLYHASSAFHYYSRISFFYFTILLHGMEVCVTMIPSWLQGKGADYVFNSFYYWCKWTGVNTTVYGTKFTQIEGPAVVICNHQSSLDILSMASIWPKNCVVMMKKILVYIPFFNLGSYFSNSIFIDRYNREKAMASVDYCATELQRRNLKLWIFPEGTRNRDGGFIPFKKGAFNIAVRAQVPIIPVVFSDYRPFYSFVKKYFRNDGEVVIRALEPISTEGLTLDDVPALADKCRDVMFEAYKNVTSEALERVAARRGETKKSN
uniref:1-acyl-sn-glycerol-3-phosphate acyltransferase n=1 Tax=Caenorhabditis japonica TaxID=281687 RepID=A0A8R1HRF3_CAEJA